MNKKYISCLVLIAFFSHFTLTPALAFWPFSDPNPGNKDLRFETIYPVPFWNSTTGTIVKYTGIAAITVGVAVLTYMSAGTVTWAVNGVIAKFIGGIIGLSGAAAVKTGLAFLAFLGGGTLAAGGFGALGGLSVLTAISSLPLTASLVNYTVDTVNSQIPSGTHKKAITLIKPRLFWDNVSPVVKDEMKELRNTLDDIAKTGGNDSQAQHVIELMKAIDNELTYAKRDEYTAYNFLLLAIIRYNLNNFDGARSAVKTARLYTASDKSSVLDYVDALLAFQAGDDDKAVNLLRGITEAEPKASTPYIVLGQNAFDEGHYHEAFDILDRGIKAGCDEVCAMNWMAGNSLYNAGRYNAAIPYYKKALSNMTVNEIEALYKLNIAKCYRKMNDYKEGQKWLDDAISEVEDNAEMVSELRRQYNSD